MRKGIRIQAAGKAKGTNWVAVRKEGEDWGFVYAAALAPVLDGSFLRRYLEDWQSTTCLSVNTTSDMKAVIPSMGMFKLFLTTLLHYPAT